MRLSTLFHYRLAQWMAITLLALLFLGQGRWGRADDTVQPTVLEPVVDGISQKVPDLLKGNALSRLGLVDVTAPPFNADPSGRRDATDAIQRAVNYARDWQMVCYFPAGTYLVSDTIHCIQNNYLRSNEKVGGGRNFPCVLMGSRLGKGATIVLAPGSPGFNDTSHPKYLFHFWARRVGKPDRAQPNISINQMLIGVQIMIGAGNPGAVAVRHKAAQGSVIQDCRIEVGDGKTGIEGGIGSGGSITKVTITGGDIGLDLRETQPGPVIAGITLIDQRKHAIIYDGPQALSAVGLRIVSNSRGPLIKSVADPEPSSGQISLLDSTLTFTEQPGIAIAANKALYCNNVYIHNGKVAVQTGDQEAVVARPGGWLHLREYAHVFAAPPWKGYRYESSIYIDGRRSMDDLLDSDGMAPPADLQERHLWGADFPSWQSTGAVNVKEQPYGAKGDGIHDDTAALQQALQQHRIVFLPKGYYRISKPLVMGKDTALVGIGRHLSLMMVRQDGSSKNPWPGGAMLQTAIGATASNIISQCGFLVLRGDMDIAALNWQCGPASILRDVNFSDQQPQGFKRRQGPSPPLSQPFVTIKANGAGKWYNYFRDSFAEHPDYRHLLITGTNGPLSIYQCNVEHHRGGPNMEIKNSGHISIFGMKSEGNQPVVLIEDSRDVRITGYAGNAAALPGSALFVLKRSHDILLANLVDAPKIAGQKSSHGTGVDPQLWSMVSDLADSGLENVTLPLVRPVLYRRH